MPKLFRKDHFPHMPNQTIPLFLGVSHLAGYQYGAQIFQDKIAPFYKPNTNLTIEFEDELQAVATGFVQGFFAHWVNTHSINYIKRHITIKTKDSKLTQNIWEKLY